MKKILSFLLLVGVVAGSGYLLRDRLQPDIKRGTVVASFYPLQFFAERIAGDRVEIVGLVPAGVEPHDFEPTSQDIATMEQAKAVLLNGGGLEPFGERIEPLLKEKGVAVVTVGEGLIGLKSNEGEVIADPHIWLDPVLAVKMVDRIQSVLVSLDPGNRVLYVEGGEKLKKELGELDKEFQKGLLDCRKKDFVTSHEAFGYLAARYKLNQVAIAGLSPDEEPSPKRLAEIAEFAKENSVKYIFFETLVSPRLAQTVASEIGARALVLNPIEGVSEEEQNEGKDYFTIQRENLKYLRLALECK